MDEVQITVVSDGSTDGTLEIASHYCDQIQLIDFQENRGYGAAIKAGWLASDADLLGFLDADGTCDPEFFAPLCQELCSHDLDVVLGSRLHATSQMPRMRRVGNSVFAAMLTAASSSPVRDAASGMRVVRRSCLSRLMPLPDGLHFTPAMSSRAVLGDDLRIAEIDMPYEERTGDSKLKVIKDGLRFANVIMAAAFLYRPARLLNAAALLFALASGAWMVTPLIHYLRQGTISDWMIYRFIVSQLLIIAAVLFVSGGHLAGRAVEMTLGVASARSGPSRLVHHFFVSRWFWLVPVTLLVAGGVLVLPSLLSLIPTGRTSQHWSRFATMSLLTSVALVLSFTRVLDVQLRKVRRRLEWLKSAERDLWAAPSPRELQDRPAIDDGAVVTATTVVLPH